MKIHFEKDSQIEMLQLICHWSNALGEPGSNGWDQ